MRRSRDVDVEKEVLQSEIALTAREVSALINKKQKVRALTRLADSARDLIRQLRELSGEEQWHAEVAEQLRQKISEMLERLYGDRPNMLRQQRYSLTKDLNALITQLKQRYRQTVKRRAAEAQPGKAPRVAQGSRANDIHLHREEEEEEEMGREGRLVEIDGVTRGDFSADAGDVYLVMGGEGGSTEDKLLKIFQEHHVRMLYRGRVARASELRNQGSDTIASQFDPEQGIRIDMK